jgi:hypothetical protein
MLPDSQDDATKNVWANVTQPETCSEMLQRAFCHFIMGSVSQLMPAIMNEGKPKYDRMMDTLGIVLIKGRNKPEKQTPDEAFHADLNQRSSHSPQHDCHEASTIKIIGVSVYGTRR